MKQFATPLGMSTLSDDLWDEILAHSPKETGWTETEHFHYYTSRVNGESTLTTTGESGYYQKRSGGKILQHIFDKESWDKEKACAYLEELAEKALKGGEGSGWYAPPRGTHGSGSQAEGLGRRQSVNSEESNLLDFQQKVHEMRTAGRPPLEGFAYQSHEEMVLEQGHFFDPPGKEKLPSDVYKGEMKNCFNNTFNNQKEGKYIYTEGWVMVEGLPMPFEHAWLTTPQGKVIDSTWTDGRATAYFGVQLNQKFVLETAMRTGMGGVVFNDYLDGARLLKKGWPKGALYGTTKTKGGPGSGHHGHAGRPGSIGGSAPASGGGFDSAKWEAMSISERQEAWEKLSVSERDKLVDAGNSIRDIQSERLSHAGDRPEFDGDVKGDIDKRINQTSYKDGEDFIHSDSREMISKTVCGLDDVLEKAGVKDELRQKLCMEAVDALVAQSNEAMGRSLGDHGIRHIEKNISIANDILEKHPAVELASEEASVYLASIFHDTGYLAEPSQMFLDEGHPRWSTQHYDENIRPLVTEALGGRVAGDIGHMIRTHDATTMDWKEDTVASAVRVADNLALFHGEKMPPLFHYVPANTKVLVDLGSGKIDVSSAQKKMLANIKKSSLSSEVKNQLSKAVGEVGAITPKFTLGMLGGKLERVGWSGNKLNVYLKADKNYTKYNKAGDFGQKQFAKFAKTYGANPASFVKDLKFTFRDSSGNPLLESYLLGWKMKLRLDEMDPVKLSELEEADLIEDHERLHEYYAEWLKGEHRDQEGGDWSYSDLLKAHIFVVEELRKRGKKCEYDDDLAKAVKKLIERCKEAVESFVWDWNGEQVKITIKSRLESEED